MKRSARISLHLVPIVAAAFLAACDRTPERRACADWQGQVVDDGNCPPDGAPRTYVPSGGPYYRWYWYRGYDPIMVGHPIPVGGSYAGPTSRGGGSRRASGTTRGGFGSTAAGHGGSGS